MVIYQLTNVDDKFIMVSYFLEFLILFSTNA
jgi:hypothetical protein